MLNKYFCGRNLINSSQIPQYLLTLEEQNWDFRTIYKVSVTQYIVSIHSRGCELYDLR